jgi:hypothetical protein
MFQSFSTQSKANRTTVSQPQLYSVKSIATVIPETSAGNDAKAAAAVATALAPELPIAPSSGTVGDGAIGEMGLSASHWLPLRKLNLCVENSVNGGSLIEVFLSSI